MGVGGVGQALGVAADRLFVGAGDIDAAFQGGADQVVAGPALRQGFQQDVGLQGQQGLAVGREQSGRGLDVAGLLRIADQHAHDLEPRVLLQPGQQATADHAAAGDDDPERGIGHGRSGGRRGVTDHRAVGTTEGSDLDVDRPGLTQIDGVVLDQGPAVAARVVPARAAIAQRLARGRGGVAVV